MKNLWKRWLALLVIVIAVGSLFIRLGEWQLHRLAWRRANNAIVERYQNAPVKPYTDVMGKGRIITDDQQWQRVTLTGTYDAKHQVQALLRNTLDSSSQAGSEVLTPMHTVQGDWVLVDRGFIVRGDNSTIVAMPAPPSGTVTVVGYLRRDEQGKQDALTPSNGAVRLVSAPMISTILPYKLVDGFVGLVQSTPAQSGGMLPMSTPEITEGPHLSYAIQWFCFTAIGVVGAGMLVRADITDRKKREAKAARREQRRAQQVAALAAVAQQAQAGSSPAPQSTPDRVGVEDAPTTNPTKEN